MRRGKFLQTDIHLAISKDELRPAMQHVFFKDGFLYATDAHVLIKQYMKLHDFTDEEIKILNLKMIHRESLIQIKKYDLFEVQEEGILCVGNYNQRALFQYADNESVGQYPDCDAVIKDEHGQVSEVGIKPEFLTKISKCMFGYKIDGVILNFGKKNTDAIFITTSAIDRDRQLGLLSPVMINR